MGSGRGPGALPLPARSSLIPSPLLRSAPGPRAHSEQLMAGSACAALGSVNCERAARQVCRLKLSRPTWLPVCRSMGASTRLLRPRWPPPRQSGASQRRTKLLLAQQLPQRQPQQQQQQSRRAGRAERARPGQEWRRQQRRRRQAQPPARAVGAAQGLWPAGTARQQGSGGARRCCRSCAWGCPARRQRCSSTQSWLLVGGWLHLAVKGEGGVSAEVAACPEGGVEGHRHGLEPGTRAIGRLWHAWLACRGMH